MEVAPPWLQPTNVARATSRWSSTMIRSSSSVYGAVAGGEVELDGLADADVVDAAEAQAVQGAFDSLALDVEDAGLEEDLNLSFH